MQTKSRYYSIDLEFKVNIKSAKAVKHPKIAALHYIVLHNRHGQKSMRIFKY